MARLVRDWKYYTKNTARKTSEAALNQTLAIMQSIFEKSSHYAMNEVCDYVDQIYPEIKRRYMRKLKCNPRYGFNGMGSPLRLIKHVTRHMKMFAQPDYVIMNGDFVAHFRALKAQPSTFEAYKAQQQEHLNITKTAFDAIRRRLGPNVPLLPTIGNNDVPVHNQMPCDQQQHDLYFKDLFDLFFPAGHQPKDFN